MRWSYVRRGVSAEIPHQIDINTSTQSGGLRMRLNVSTGVLTDVTTYFSGVGSTDSYVDFKVRLSFYRALNSPINVDTQFILLTAIPGGALPARSLYTLLHLCMSLFCLLRVLLFALGRVLT